MSLRYESLQRINPNKKDQRFASNVKGRPISEYFGSMVFGVDAIKKYLMRDAYENLMTAIEKGERIDDRTADFVAVGMRNWAIDNGATHYSHWFQPLTGKTAEKHEAFFKLDKNGNPIESLSGADLIKREADASSFPSGGLRATHCARGYTIWDPSSYAFLMESSQGKTLCIPTIFISFTGEALDLKTPLLRSISAIDKNATAVCKLFDEKINKVTPTLGWEQEYFVVDEALFNARPDLMQCGRTLFGKTSARNQQLDDHYFASIPERVLDFMLDFEDDCLMMGIPITTRHNEVAPTQFECAPYFEYANVAADHNQLIMDIIDKVARRHQLRALIHEKPFAGINGSGKHNNWSLATDTGRNLLSPKGDAQDDLLFLTFFVTTIRAIHDYAHILRATIANAGNEHRLGANEAPPAIISVFTGEYLNSVLETLKTGERYESKEDQTIDVNLNKISVISKDNTDRNRTSPFPFTDNRFEFRAVGSSVNVSHPVTAINTMVADVLGQFKIDVDNKMAEGIEKFEAIKAVLREYIIHSEKVIFNGNGYSDEWVEEAERRGLPNIKSTPEALQAMIKEDTIAIYERNGVLTKKELIARHNVAIEEYIARIDIEAELVVDIVNSLLVPSVVNYQNKLIDSLRSFSKLNIDAKTDALKARITSIANHLDDMMNLNQELADSLDKAEEIHDEEEKARFTHDVVKELCTKVRSHADALESIVDDKLWPLPKYRELLFLH